MNPLDDLECNRKEMHLNPRNIKGRTKPMSKKALLIAYVVGIVSTVAYNHFTATEQEWTKYLPTGQMTLAKTKMRVCQDKTVCPNGYKDAPSIKVYYPSAPEPAPASIIPPSESLKMSEVPTLEESATGPLASHVNSTGKQLISMLGNFTQRIPQR